MLTDRENFLRNVHFQGPQWMPCSVCLSDGSWYQLGAELEDVCLRHPVLFPGFKKGSRELKPPATGVRTERDSWGCLWRFDLDGLEGLVVEHPLDDWAKFEGFMAPDPALYSDRDKHDWPAFESDVKSKREKGQLAYAGLPHGYFFMRLWYLRGFENLMLDVASGEPRLQDLCDMLTKRNCAIVKRFIDAGVDGVVFGEDIGTQIASILSPKDFRKWIASAYRKMMDPVKRAGIIVDTHSDGYIMELVDDLLACGCDVLNPQDLCNGIDNIARHIKGRCCIRLDVDRQRIVPFGTRKEIHGLIEEEVRKLGSPQGGLELVAGVYPPTPAENIDALCEAFEKFRTWWWD